MNLSKNHLGFLPRLSGGFWEYFTVGADVYRAPSDNPIAVAGPEKGYRQGGRMEFATWQIDRYGLKVLTGHSDFLTSIGDQS
jgi:hypothetical protein